MTKIVNGNGNRTMSHGVRSIPKMTLAVDWAQRNRPKRNNDKMKRLPRSGTCAQYFERPRANEGAEEPAERAKLRKHSTIDYLMTARSESPDRRKEPRAPGASHEASNTCHNAPDDNSDSAREDCRLHTERAIDALDVLGTLPTHFLQPTIDDK